MPVYHQMGFASENLLHVPELSTYRGAILSPVNYELSDMIDQIQRLPAGFETIFDPQLYYPNSERGFLRDWPYFPSDVDTADLTSAAWWHSTTESIVNTCRLIRATAVCTPAFVPRSFVDDYYVRLIEIGGQVCGHLNGSGIRGLQTALVSLEDVATAGRAQSIASILTATDCDETYLIFISSPAIEPRRELADPESLKGAMRLIAALRQGGMRVLVGFSSSDVVLWKAAGAHSTATGKFFNLRRFSSARFEEEKKGGGALPYWFEESLMAFLRESDVIRVNDRQLLSDSSQRNPFCQQILSRDGTPWSGLGWRQFMWWFADIEARIDQGAANVRDLLRQAEARWVELEDADVLMEEARNNGSWLRPWRRALAEYATF